tara:strand:+ start:67 stop:243 length:177 start_codon:yes stop_codon:yes gene_type:complete
MRGENELTHQRAPIIRDHQLRSSERSLHQRDLARALEEGALQKKELSKKELSKKEDKV